MWGAIGLAVATLLLLFSILFVSWESPSCDDGGDKDLDAKIDKRLQERQVLTAIGLENDHAQKAAFAKAVDDDTTLNIVELSLEGPMVEQGMTGIRQTMHALPDVAFLSEARQRDMKCRTDYYSDRIDSKIHTTRSERYGNNLYGYWTNVNHTHTNKEDGGYDYNFNATRKDSIFIPWGDDTTKLFPNGYSGFVGYISLGSYKILSGSTANSSHWNQRLNVVFYQDTWGGEQTTGEIAQRKRAFKYFIDQGWIGPNVRFIVGGDFNLQYEYVRTILKEYGVLDYATLYPEQYQTPTGYDDDGLYAVNYILVSNLLLKDVTPRLTVKFMMGRNLQHRILHLALYGFKAPKVYEATKAAVYAEDYRTAKRDDIRVWTGEPGASMPDVSDAVKKAPDDFYKPEPQNFSHERDYWYKKPDGSKFF